MKETIGTYVELLPELSGKTLKNLTAISDFFEVKWQTIQITPVQQTRRWGGSPKRWAKSFLITGKDKLGRKIEYFRKETSHPGAGQSYIKVDGKHRMKATAWVELATDFDNYCSEGRHREITDSMIELLLDKYPVAILMTHEDSSIRNKAAEAYKKQCDK